MKQFDNTAIPLADVADLTVTVVGSEVRPAPSHDEFPTWGGFDELASSRSDGRGSGGEQGGFC